MSEDPTDELVRAASRGDRKALEELLCASMPDLRRLVERRTGPMLKERLGESDIVQSVCREILTRGETFQHPSVNAFRRWLYATTLRKLSNRRAELTSIHRDVSREARLITEDGRTMELCDSDQATPSSQAIVAEELQRLEAALDALPEESREVIVQAKISGRSREEIAAAFGKSTGAVRMQLHRALAQLAVLMDQSRPEPAGGDLPRGGELFPGEGAGEPE